MRQRMSKPVETPYEMTEDEARIVAWLEKLANELSATARLAHMATGFARASETIRRGEHRR